MEVKETFLRILQLALCGFGMINSFYVITELMYFLSVPKKPEPFKEGRAMYYTCTSIIKILI